MQTDHRISARKPVLIIINKKEITCRIVDFTVPWHHEVNLKECEKKDKYLDLARELKKNVEHENDDYKIVIGALGTITISTKSGELGNNGTGGDPPN